MAIVEFANGRRVEFDGTPTPEDIDYVASQLGITPENQNIRAEPQQPSMLGRAASAVGGFAQKVGQSLVSPVLGIAATPVQAAAKAIGAEDPFKKGLPVAGLGEVPVSELGVRQKLGDIAQTGALLVPGKGVLGAAGAGALLGGGAAASRGAQIQDIATQGLIGAGTGALVGGALRLGGAGLKKTGELISGKTAEKAVQGIKSAYSDALNLPASQRAFESRSGKDLADVLVRNRAPLGINAADNTLDASQAIDVLRSKLDPLNQRAQDLLNNPQGVVSFTRVSDVVDDVIKGINKSSITSLEKEIARKEVQKIADATIREYGDELTPAVVDQVKNGFWNSVFAKTKFAPPIEKLRGDVNYQLGKAFQKAEERAIAKTDAGDVLGVLNAERSDLIDAIKRLSTLDGVARVKGTRLGPAVSEIVGAIAGSTVGGAPGTIAGGFFGNQAARFLTDPATRIGFARGKARAAEFVPGVLGKVAKPTGQVIERIGKAAERLARPAGFVASTESTQ